jgi:hypothetical protein
MPLNNCPDVKSQRCITNFDNTQEHNILVLLEILKFYTQNMKNNLAVNEAQKVTILRNHVFDHDTNMVVNTWGLSIITFCEMKTYKS